MNSFVKSIAESFQAYSNEDSNKVVLNDAKLVCNITDFSSAENLSEELTDEGLIGSRKISESDFIEKNMEHSPLQNKGSLKESERRNFVESLLSNDIHLDKSKSFASKFEENKYFCCKECQLTKRRFNSGIDSSCLNQAIRRDAKVKTPNCASSQKSKGSLTLKEDISFLLKQAAKKRKETISEIASHYGLREVINEENIVDHDHRNESDSYSSNFVTMNDVHPGY